MCGCEFQVGSLGVSAGLLTHQQRPNENTANVKTEKQCSINLYGIRKYIDSPKLTKIN